MNDLTFSIYYTPNNDIQDNLSELKLTCWDKKIHIRFRDFNKEEIIYGFEKKLTYLLTYLMNYSYMPKVIGMYDEKTLIESFLKTSDVYQIISTIGLQTSSEPLKGFKIYRNYKKNDENILPFGCVDNNCFPLVKNEGIIQQGSLTTFLDILKVDLNEYLFNDNYMIVIRENRLKDMNKKFINKTMKKSSRISGADLDIAQLW